MNLDHDFFQVSKLSEDQKKKSSPNMEQVKNKRKKVFPTNGTLFSPNSSFFPQFQVETCAQMHTRVKLLEGMQMKTILKLLKGFGISVPSKFSPPAKMPEMVRTF